MKRGWMLLVAVLLLTPWAARAEVMVKLDGRGAQIGLLREYETEWASLREELEAVSVQVGLSSEKVDGCVFTVDQVAASDRYILVFYTITGDEPFVRPQDRSIYGWHAESGTMVFLDAVLDGHGDNDLWAGSNTQQFFRDDHTLVGWGLLFGTHNPVHIPEVAEVDLRAWVGRGLSNTECTVSFTLDRSTKMPGFYAGDIDVPLVCKMPDDRGAQRKLRFTHLSMSPLGNLLTVEEELIGADTQLCAFDEAGKPLTRLYGSSSMRDASPQHPRHVRTQFAFVGGRDGRKVTLAPRRIVDKGVHLRLPIDVALPYTHTYANGQQFTLLSLMVDRNGLEAKYVGESEGRVQFVWFYDAEGRKIDLLDGSAEDSLDRGTGIRTTTIRWSPEKGAEPGERITRETLGRLKSVDLSSAPVEPMMEYAVTIEIPEGG